MWARMSRVLRRGALLVPLALTALALFLLPRPQPPLFPIPAERLSWSTPTHEIELQPILVSENEIIQHKNESVVKPLWFMRGGGQRPTITDARAAKLFPEDAPGEDRIIDQLMYTLPADEKVQLKTILLVDGYKSWNVSPGQKEFLKNKCPVHQCTLISDPRADDIDVVIFKEHTQYSIRGPPNQIWIQYYLENPYHTTLFKRHRDSYNWTATYRRDSDIVTPYERWVYYDPEIVEKVQKRNYAANKTKKVAWFVSNCHARNTRLQYAHQLAKHIQVDIYGACGTRTCPRDDPNCFEMLDKDYKFYLAFENGNCRDYISEKFFVNGLQHNVLPVVMGARASEYAAVAPHNSYVHVDEFAGPEELAAYLHRLDKDDELYNSYFKWKGTGEFVNTYFFCRVCAMVHANDLRQRKANYEDLQMWWRSDNACTKRQWRDND